MLSIIGKIISFFANLIPTTNIILFHSFPDVADNSFAMCRYLHKIGVDTHYSFAWLIDSKDKGKLYKMLENEEIKAKLVKCVSPKGVWLFSRARYVFVTHGLFDIIHLKQHSDKIINLWHGMPLKLLGASEERGIPCSTNFDYVYPPAPYFRRLWLRRLQQLLRRF